MKHYLIIGRFWGDDKDTHLPLQAESRAAAKAVFVEYMGCRKGVRSADRVRPGFYVTTTALINGIFESEAEIKEAT